MPIISFPYVLLSTNQFCFRICVAYKRTNSTRKPQTLLSVVSEEQRWMCPKFILIWDASVQIHWYVLWSSAFQTQVPKYILYWSKMASMNADGLIAWNVHKKNFCLNYLNQMYNILFYETWRFCWRLIMYYLYLQDTWRISCFPYLRLWFERYGAFNW